jgi:hypothetical protein
MTPSLTVRHAAAESVCLVRWIFHRSGSSLTCQVDAGATGSYDVSVVPHWNVAAGAIETVETPGRALQRHAEIAKQLRENGWLLARQVVTAPITS